MKSYRLVASLFSLALLTCSRAPTLLVTVENLPPTALSLQVTATHGELAAIVNLDPLDLPQPTPATSTFLLRLPPSFSGDIGVNVGAFKSASGTGCLVATGSTTTPMFAGPDETMRVPLVPAEDKTCDGKSVFLNNVAPVLGNVNGGETLTLTGWGFKPGAKVTFGTSSARSVTYVSAAQLKVVTPAKAGFGATPIKVTNLDNTSATRSDLFKFYADTIDFTGLPFTSTGDYSNSNGFVFGIFNPATTIDAVVAQRDRDMVRVLLVTGTLTSTVDYAMPMGSMPTGVTAADFNHDGKLDVAVSSPGDSKVRILLNDGLGNLTQSGIAPVDPGAESIATGDLNGDGNADVVVANRMSNTITIAFGDGMGGFKTPVATVGAITDPSSIAIGDLNFDGQPDIAIANYSTGMVSLLFNDMGNFGGAGRYSKAALPLGKSINTILITDINNDGKPDILAADSGMNQIVVLQNMGIPNILQYSLPTEASPRAVQAGDLNGDGYPDLVVPCNTPSTANVFLNNAGKGFQQVKYQTVGAQCMRPVQAAIYDIDRDGRLDVGVLCEVGVGLLINHSGL